MCARTQFMTDSFLWAERPIMSKTNETMKHNAEAAQFHPGQPSSHRQSQDKCTDHGSCKVQLAPTQCAVGHFIYLLLQFLPFQIHIIVFSLISLFICFYPSFWNINYRIHWEICIGTRQLWQRLTCKYQFNFI